MRCYWRQERVGNRCSRRASGLRIARSTDRPGRVGVWKPMFCGFVGTQKASSCATRVGWGGLPSTKPQQARPFRPCVVGLQEKRGIRLDLHASAPVLRIRKAFAKENPPGMGEWERGRTGGTGRRAMAEAPKPFVGKAVG